jgi:hypothetical protein
VFEPKVLLGTAAAVTVASLAIGVAASADQAPIPLKAPTGYQDYCAAMPRAQRNRVCSRGGVPQTLWRPLHLPAVAPGAACPVSTRRSITRYMTGVGAGPIYPTHVDPWNVPFPPPENSVAFGTGWSVDKTPLVRKKTFKGPFAVRGRRIDGSGQLGFSGPGVRRPVEALQFAAGHSGLEVAGLTGWPILVWMTGPGCYGLQIDGLTFSRVVVFQVRNATS